MPLSLSLSPPVVPPVPPPVAVPPVVPVPVPPPAGGGLGVTKPVIPVVCGRVNGASLAACFDPTVIFIFGSDLGGLRKLPRVAFFNFSDSVVSFIFGKILPKVAFHVSFPILPGTQKAKCTISCIGLPASSGCAANVLLTELIISLDKFIAANGAPTAEPYCDKRAA